MTHDCSPYVECKPSPWDLGCIQTYILFRVRFAQLFLTPNSFMLYYFSSTGLPTLSSYSCANITENSTAYVQHIPEYETIRIQFVSHFIVDHQRLLPLQFSLCNRKSEKLTLPALEPHR